MVEGGSLFDADYPSKWVIFACRFTPEVMKMAIAPIGPENDAWIAQLASTAGVVIAAWGNEGGFAGRSVQIRRMLPKMQCLKMNKTGEPAHPLYQPKSALPISMSVSI